MIIAFDGNVGVGKTTLVKTLYKNKGFSYIPEQGNFLKLENEAITTIETREDYCELQKKYLEAECMRTSLVTSENIFLLDRSFVSMAAHVFALYLTKGIDIREWFVEKMDLYFKERKIIIPNVYVCVVCNRDELALRIQKKKNTDDFYVSVVYMAAIDEFNKTWTELVSGCVIDTTTFLPIELAEKNWSCLITKKAARSVEKTLYYLRRALWSSVNTQKQ